MDARVAVVPVGGVGVLSFVTQSRPDRFISETLLRGDEWEAFESLVFRRCVTAGAVVCDVGANLGWYSVIAAKLGASVIAFEPDPESFELLRMNLELNGCIDVSAYCFALSDHDGEGLLSLSPDNQGDQRLTANDIAADRTVISVPLRRLDGALAEHQVNVLKVDTQGAEAAILRGAAEVVRGASALFVEFWPRGLESNGDTVDDLLAQLSKFGHELFEFDPIDRALLRTSAAELAERADSGRFSAAGGGHLDLLALTPEMIHRVSDFVRERTPGRPLAEPLEPAQRRRVELAARCNDATSIPKVAEAGTLQHVRGTDVQVMHNGVLVVAGGYYGAWQSEIIERLRGHHEPQEERVFHEIVQRLVGERSDDRPPIIVELGAFWSYYSLWFLRSLPHGRAVLVEPDPSHLAVLHANLALNDRSATVIEAAIGDASSSGNFECEDGRRIKVERLTLVDVLNRAGIARADVVLSDIQGQETQMLETACAVLAQRVRFLIVSTHHESISGRRDTHQRCLSIIRQSGGHIIAEHSVAESFSGDGLIAASFDARDRDMHVSISRARAEWGLFAEDVELQRHVDNLEHSLTVAVEYVHALETQRADLLAQVQQRRWRRRRRA